VSHVFTYGSLMFERVWSRVAAGTYATAVATLAGYRRQRVRGEDYPSLTVSAGDQAGEDAARCSAQEPVHGLLYLDVDAADLGALDAFEGPEYRRIRVEVTVQEQVEGGPPPGSAVEAETYLYVDDGRVEPGPWDPEEFERQRMDRFLGRYAPPAA
jgi:gamma-glutamylcyclotransferase (GGCT)/AIG2-like uncharacterized protein YtfP